VIAIYSPKGGVGCTTIATNLAIALAQRSRRPVAIVDLDLQFGDVGIALDLRSANSIVDLLDHVDAIDDALVDEVFVKHRSGVRALLAPENLALVETIDPDRVISTIDQLRDHFRFVVCDLWSSFEELTLAALRTADRVVLVTTPELPALKNIRRVINATAPLLSEERTLVVLNRYPGKVGLPLADIERGLARTVAVTIPSEGVGITEAINQGISLFDARARVGVRASRGIERLAQLIAKPPERKAAPQRERSASPSVA
jgi:pilus assembly protein CpaE